MLSAQYWPRVSAAPDRRVNTDHKPRLSRLACRHVHYSAPAATGGITNWTRTVLRQTERGNTFENDVAKKKYIILLMTSNHGGKNFNKNTMSDDRGEM